MKNLHMCFFFRTFAAEFMCAGVRAYTLIIYDK